MIVILVTAVCILQGVFCLGSSLTVIYFYARDNRFRHILAVSFSHCLLTILVTTAIAGQIVNWFPWRLPLAMLAFALTDYGLYEIRRKRQRN